MSDATRFLELPMLAAAQAQKHVTHNEALQRLDQIVHIAVPSRAGPSDPPGAPVEGERHLVPVAPPPTGAWSNHGGHLAAFVDGAWSFAEPLAGWTIFVADEAALYVHDGEALVRTDAPLPEQVERWGVGTPPDAVNRFAIASPASLFTHAGAGHRMVVNKAARADTATILFQTGFSGRAEFGLAGSDGFGVKVSADGAAWKEAMRIDPASGAAGFVQGLAFGAAGSATSSVLKHYEEGAFTPQLRGATTAGTPTYAQADGSFTRIGNLVVANGRLVWTALGGLTGSVTITGLPYPCRGGLANRFPMIASWYNSLAMGPTVTMLGGFTEPGTPNIRLWGASDAGEGINKLLTHSDVSEDGEIYFNCVYMTLS